MTFYGRDEGEWDTLIEVTTRFLEERARLQTTTSYTELNAVLVRRTGLAPFDFASADDRAAMGHLLGEVARDSVAGGGPMLSALVIYLNENDAGSGFYSLAQDLGLLSRGASKVEREKFWVDQLNAIYQSARSR